MRERTVKVDTNVLIKLSDLYKSVNVARKIGVSKQLWHKYKGGKCDIPESTVARICDNYGLDRDKLVMEAI